MQEVTGSTPVFSTFPLRYEHWWIRSPDHVRASPFMPLSPTLLHRLAGHLGGLMGSPIRVQGADPLGGGSINDAYRLETSAGRYFVKVNRAERLPSLFEAEA